MGSEENSGESPEGGQLSTRSESLILFDYQGQAIETWAKANGVRIEGDINKYFKAQYGEPFQTASESDVYYDGADVVKAFEPGALYDSDMRLALDKLIIGNAVFPETISTIERIGRTYYGQLIFVLRQSHIEGEPATKEDIARYFDALRMTKESSTSFHDDNIIISDMKVDNVVKVGKEIIAIDCNFEYNKDSKKVDWSFTIGYPSPIIGESEEFEASGLLGEETILFSRVEPGELYDRIMTAVYGVEGVDYVTRCRAVRVMDDCIFSPR